jgi:hypothetical protein
MLSFHFGLTYKAHFLRDAHWVTRGSAKHYFKPFKQTFFALVMKLLHRHAVTAIFGYSLVQKLA